MPFIKPDISFSTSLCVVADWIELKLLQADSGPIKASDLRRMLEVQSEYGGESFDSDDLHIDDTVSRWFEEIKIRENALGDSYPFFISDNKIVLKKIRKFNKPGIYSYILCLFLSHAQDTDALNGSLFLNLKNNDPAREYFQIISTIAASGYLNGSSISFGWPRQDASKFVEALKRVVEKSFDKAMIRKTVHPAAPKEVKDYEIDIISWIPANDNMPGKVFLISQVASGYNWHSKPLRSEILKNLSPWLSQGFASENNITTGLFIPFCVEPKNNEKLHDTLHYLCNSQSNNIVFYRYRIPHYVQQVFESGLSEKPGIEIERNKDIDKMYNWVNEKITLLKSQIN